MLGRKEICKIFDSHWKPGWGSVCKDDLEFILDLIATYSPKDFLEIGTASGLSGGFISTFMSHFNGKSFTTIDHDNTFFGDSSKPNGFLLNQIFNGSTPSVDFQPFKKSSDIPELNKHFSMCFIDANHHHPWPTLDLMMAAPFLKDDKIVILDDLDLYKKQPFPCIGIGPKILHDQFPDSIKLKGKNSDIFGLKLSNIRRSDFEECIMNSLMVPWTTRSKLKNTNASKKYLEVTKKLFSNELHQCLITTLNKFDVTNRTTN